jgi:hypothetical protein
MDEFWKDLARDTFAGSGQLICNHNTSYQCKITLVQLFTGQVVVKVSNFDPKVTVIGFPRHCEYFNFVGLVDGKSDLTVKNIRFTRKLLSEQVDMRNDNWLFEGYVHLPGFVQITRPDADPIRTHVIICELTNLFLGRQLVPSEATFGQAQIRFENSYRGDDHRRIEALRTSGILGQVEIRNLANFSENEIAELVGALCAALTLAQRSPISCVGQHWKDESGIVVRSRFQEPVFEYPARVRPLIEGKSLAAFVQAALQDYKICWKDWDLGHAIDHYVQVMTLGSAWSQAIGFFTALETLKNAFLHNQGRETLEFYVPKNIFKKGQIVSKVEALLSDNFSTFRELSKEEKESLTGKVGELNRRAYKLILRAMFQELGVICDNEELKRLVDLRNQIIHRGSPDYERSPWKDPSEAFLHAAKFAGIVERVFLAILDYHGDFEPYERSIVIVSEKSD